MNSWCLGNKCGYCGIKDVTKEKWEIAIELLKEWQHKEIGYLAVSIMLDEIKNRTQLGDNIMTLPLIYHTKGDSSVYGKKHVYITGHPEDIRNKLDFLCKQIFQQFNCVISHIDIKALAKNHAVSEEDLGVYLNHSNGVILIVTKRFLDEENFSSSREIPYLIKNKIPFLPLFFEYNLENLFNEKWNSLHGLSPLSIDRTAISFEQKLFTFLINTIGTEEENREIADVFSKHIFLSYRKKDREHANDLMRHLHSDEYLYDTAIWYDEFLNPGENFNDSILEQIKNADLVIFLITKNFLEEGNYIEKVEFKKAVQADKQFLAVECEPVDHQLLEKRYPGITSRIISRNTVSDHVCRALKLSQKLKNGSPHDLYLLSLAFSRGYHVEQNLQKGKELLEAAAKQNEIKALTMLASNYAKGFYGEQDLEKALKYYEKALELYRKKVSDEYSDILVKEMHECWNEMLELYRSVGEEDSFSEELAEQHTFFEAILREHPSLELYTRLLFHYDKAGDFYMDSRQFEIAEYYYEKMEELGEFIKKHPELVSDDLPSTQSTFVIYTNYDYMQCLFSYNRALLCEKRQDYMTALQFYSQTEAMIHSFSELRDSSACRSLLGSVYKAKGEICYHNKDYSKALSYFKKAQQLVKKCIEEEPDYQDFYMQFLNICLREALTLCQSGFTKRCEDVIQHTLKVCSQLQAEDEYNVEINLLGAKLLVVLGDNYIRMKKFDQANQSYQKARNHIFSRKSHILSENDVELLYMIAQKLIEQYLKQLDKLFCGSLKQEAVLNDCCDLLAKSERCINDLYDLRLLPQVELTRRFCEYQRKLAAWHMENEEFTLSDHYYKLTLIYLENHLQKQWDPTLADFWCNVCYEYMKNIAAQKEIASWEALCFRIFSLFIEIPQMLEVERGVELLTVAYRNMGLIYSERSLDFSSDGSRYEMVSTTYFCAGLLILDKYKEHLKEEIYLQAKVDIMICILSQNVSLGANRIFTDLAIETLTRYIELTGEVALNQSLDTLKERRRFSRLVPKIFFRRKALEGIVGIRCVCFQSNELAEYILKL